MATNRTTSDRRPLLASALFVVLLVSGLGTWPVIRTQLCPSILVASSSEKAGLMSTLAADYSATHRNTWAGCADVVRSEQVASGDAERELSQGWPNLGTQPDVWAPAAITWVDLLRQASVGTPEAVEVPAEPIPRIAASPLVVAMPDVMARALGWPSAQPTWRDLLELAASPNGWAAKGHPELGAFRLGKTDPTKSTSGIHSLLAEYYAATGKSFNLQLADLQQPSTREFLREVEASVSHYAPTAGDFLSNIAASAGDSSYISAIPVEEQEVFAYNEGGYSADGLPPRDPLDAIYPAGGTLFADHPFVILRTKWVTDVKRAMADDFVRWLQAGHQQARFAAAGFRDFDHRAGPELTAEPGVVADQPMQTLATPDPAVLTAVVLSWQTFRKSARILLVLDLDNASQRDPIVAGIAGLGSNDQVGVMSSTLQSLVPISTLAASRNEVIAAIKSAPLARGPTPLYSSIQDAFTQLSDAPDASRINAVVVIAVDGNLGTTPTLTALERELIRQKTSLPVRVYTVALGAADRKALSGIERASGGYASSSHDPASAIRTCLANF